MSDVFIGNCLLLHIHRLNITYITKAPANTHISYRVIQHSLAATPFGLPNIYSDYKIQDNNYNLTLCDTMNALKHR